MMEKFSIIKSSPQRTAEMATMQNWVEKYICGISLKQNVVGNRTDDLGLKITPLMIENKDKWAHVCPFVRDALDYNLFWIEESKLDNSYEIENYLKQNITLFKQYEPSFDPVLQNKGAELPTLWKTSLVFFPFIKHRSKGGFSLMDNIHKNLKSTYIKAGLMLGQFYYGCPVPAVHNPFWRGPLISPFPAFAVRYMAKHDYLFIDKDSSDFADYLKFFKKSSFI